MKNFCLSRTRYLFPVLIASSLVAIPETVVASTIDYPRDIQPIFAEHCARCHGVDEKSRESELRLDLRDGALRGGASGEPAIVPGKPEESQLLIRVTSADPDRIMPPPSENKPLSAEQIERLTRWIRDGASYSEHWAFARPKKEFMTGGKPIPQQLPTGTADRHPIDRFVRAKLDGVGLAPSPPADSEVLCRRLYLDLIGLPPSPQQVDRFKVDGVQKTVDDLLASERFGEKWARHWLDVARYADTNGYEKDMRRDQWIWRDWVVSALNRDLPYHQFLVEQIAGDMLPNATQDQVVATGFLRNSMINEEGAIVPEQFRMVEMFDRLDCIGKAVLGLTTQCAQCHSHKFDPLSQDEYYGMFAFLNNAYEARSWIYTDEQMKVIGDLDRQIAVQEDGVRQRHPNWPSEMRAWETDVLAKLPVWTSWPATQLESVSGLNHPVQLADRSILMLGHSSGDVFVVAKPELNGVTGLQLEILPHRDLPFGGPGRNGVGMWDMIEFEVYMRRPDQKEWEKLKLVQATADFAEPEEKYAEGKKSRGPVGLVIDGVEDTAWRADRGIGRRNQASVAVFRLEKPLENVPVGTEMKWAWRMTEMVGCCRISTTQHPEPAARAIDHQAILAMRASVADRTAAQERAIFAAWRSTLADAHEANRAIDELWKKYPVAHTSVLHLAEREASNRRPTHSLDRGEWDRPRQAIEPHTPAILHPFPDDGPRDRLAFARWLASDQSPLTARVAVNRIWQALFGEGLVETSEDFGTRTPVPEYRELLDWLAVDFMEHGWSQKRLIQRIVTSETYQQSSRLRPDLLERDPRNRLLARGPRFRCDAEVVRDIALGSSGLITQRLGGAPTIPPVPQNVLNFNFVYPEYWTPTVGLDRYRRTLYTFRKRSMPDPTLSSFDSPNGDFACARRVRSNTPLAALTGLNETIFAESARALALRVLREGGATDADRAAYAFRLCTARWPSAEEQQQILELLASRRTRLAEGWINAREIATGDPAKMPELPTHTTPQDAAAWTLVSRVMLNLDETVTKN